MQITLEFSEDNWDKIQTFLAQMSHKVLDQKLESLLLYGADQLERKRKKVDLATLDSESSVVAVSASAVTSTSTQPASAVTSTSTQSASTVTSKSAQSVSTTTSTLKSITSAQSDLSNLHHNSPPMRRQRTQTGRAYISVKTKRQVFEKAQHKCQYVSPLTGEVCDSHHYLDIDHKKPIALGGFNSEENLRVLCRAHNHLMAKLMHLSGPR